MSGTQIEVPPTEPRTLVSWPCCEPSAFRVELAEADLVQHLLVMGATGTGKSTLLTSANRQLISYLAEEPRERLGLLVLDAKNEGMVQEIQAMAREARRGSDVVVLGPEGNCFLDLFGGLKSLEDVETLTRRLLMATPPVGGDNPYWQTATGGLIAAGLTLLAATQTSVSLDLAVQFFRSWLFGRRSNSALVENVLARARELQKDQEGQPPSPRELQLLNAMDQVALWNDLDPRTRSNLQSCLMLVWRPLMSRSAAACFSSLGRPPFDPASIAEDGLVCVTSVNALTQPDLAQFLFRLTRQMFFDAVQKRKGSHHRLCGLIADEFPLVVRREDAEQLATVRSRRCFVMAAIQGLSGLDDRIGVAARRAVVQNFNTVVFLRSLEEETGRFAGFALGTRSEPRPRKPPGWPEGELAMLTGVPSASALVPVCAPGALNRLASHQAFILFRDGSRTEYPVWFAPPPDSPKERVTAAPPAQSTKDYPLSPQRQAVLMARLGCQRWLTPDVVEAALGVWTPKVEPRKVLERVADFFRARAHLVPRGLERLPLRWLTALPGILWGLRNAYWTRLPFAINEMACEQGMLLLGFTHEQDPTATPTTAGDLVRVIVNRSIYPSLWRPLSLRLYHELWRRHPELRPALSRQSPDVSPNAPWASAGAIHNGPQF